MMIDDDNNNILMMIDDEKAAQHGSQQMRSYFGMGGYSHRILWGGLAAAEGCLCK